MHEGDGIDPDRIVLRTEDQALVGDQAQRSQALLAVSQEEQDLTNQKQDAELQKQKAELARLAESIARLRSLFGSSLFAIMWVWCIAIIAVVVLQGWGIEEFALSDAAITAFFTGASAQVIGLVVVVVRSLFPTKPE